MNVGNQAARYMYRVGIFAVVLMCISASLVLFAQPAAAVRFKNRSLYIDSGQTSAETYYIVSLTYPSASSVGALRMEFCDNPIPSLPCTIPAGLSAADAVLTAQSGEVGFTIAEQTDNLIIISRSPLTTSSNSASSYRFDGMINPSGTTQDFYIRLSSHSSLSAAQLNPASSAIDYGSVSAQLTPDIGFVTQVPPVLIFCVAEMIPSTDCSDASGNFKDLGELTSEQTYTATSQMLARTNAQYGLSIAVVGKTFTSGIRSISQLDAPSPSQAGVAQFGMNIVANTEPAVGSDPELEIIPGMTVALNPDYTAANFFMFRSGDVLATTDGTTRAQRFTTSYILNVPEDQAPGVYSTTVSYICVAGF